MEITVYVVQLLVGFAFTMWFMAAFVVARIVRVFVSLFVLLSILGEWPLPELPLLSLANTLSLYAFWFAFIIILTLIYRLLQKKIQKGYSAYVAAIGWILIAIFVMLRLPVALLVFVLLCDPDHILSEIGISDDFKTGAKMLLYWTIILPGMLRPNELTKDMTVMIGLMTLSTVTVPMLLRHWAHGESSASEQHSS